MASSLTTRVTLVGMAARPQPRLLGLRRRPPGEGPAEADRERPRRSLVWRVATPLVGVLSGALFVVSAHSSEGTDLRPGRFTDLASMVQYDATRVDGLKAKVSDLNTQISLLSGSIGNKQVRAVNRDAAAMRGPAGLVAQVGPGVTVTLSDAPHDVSSSSTVDPKLLIVHQQDIQAVVNAMWKAGARAVTIQGQRVVSTTGIRCIGNSVQLQGVPYSQPYVISAVGDPAALTAEIARDPYLQVYREDAADPQIAVGWDEQVEDKITAPAYDGLVGMSYAHVLPSGGSSPSS
jgi:uncharacterized protein YlxW (UPF0749 family)